MIKKKKYPYKTFYPLRKRPWDIDPPTRVKFLGDVTHAMNPAIEDSEAFGNWNKK